MKNKGEIDLWDKEQVRQLIAEICPEPTTDLSPVHYCKHCLSLYIKDEGFVDMCANCGSTDTDVATLEDYDKLYFEKFGKKLFYTD